MLGRLEVSSGEQNSVCVGGASIENVGMGIVLIPDQSLQAGWVGRVYVCVCARARKSVWLGSVINGGEHTEGAWLRWDKGRLFGAELVSGLHDNVSNFQVG